MHRGLTIALANELRLSWRLDDSAVVEGVTDGQFEHRRGPHIQRDVDAAARQPSGICELPAGVERRDETTGFDRLARRARRSDGAVDHRIVEAAVKTRHMKGQGGSWRQVKPSFGADQMFRRERRVGFVDGAARTKRMVELVRERRAKGAIDCRTY